MRALVLDAPDVPVQSHEPLAPVEFASRLGMSGRVVQLPLSDQPFNARTHDLLEVTGVGNHWASVGTTGLGRLKKLLPGPGSQRAAPAPNGRECGSSRFRSCTQRRGVLSLISIDFALAYSGRPSTATCTIDRYMWLEDEQRLLAEMGHRARLSALGFAQDEINLVTDEDRLDDELLERRTAAERLEAEHRLLEEEETAS
jgi:hypothetical protein